MTYLNKRANIDDVNRLFADENFVGRLQGFAKSKGLPREEAEGIVNTLWVKLKVFSERGELPTDREDLKAYIISSLKNLIISDNRKRKSRPEYLITDEGWSGGSLKGIDISQEEMADRGIGSFPSHPDDRILLEQMHSQFGPEGTALGKMDKEDMRNLMDLTGGLGELHPTTPGPASIREVAKKYLMDEEGFDWDAEMRAAREERDPEERRHRVEALHAKLDTVSNTLGRRLSRGQEKMREYAKASLEELISLTKVASKLDSLGLTKEADLIDSLIRMAQLDVTMEEPDHSSLPGDVKDFIKESERVLAPEVYHHFTEGLGDFLSTGKTPNINILMKLVEEAKSAQ